MPESLQAREVLGVAGCVVSLWCGALLALHLASAAPKPGAEGGFWGTLPSDWDHPEPNYVVSNVVGEFWSVLTTIPVAGALLLYQSFRFPYGPKVMLIFCLTCCMYSLAFTAHLTLQMHIFSTTVIAVMSNALLTFAMFSHVVHRSLGSKILRGGIVAVSEAILVGTVATLPYAIQHGGVWTLFVVQAPGVFLATFLASIMARRSEKPQARMTYGLVTTSGCLLSSAMVLSFVECLVGFEWGFLDSLWGFPYLHIAIHMLEQVGIYVFGVGVAALEALLLRPADFKTAEVRHLGWLPYFFCEAKEPAVTDPLVSLKPGSVASGAAPDGAVLNGTSRAREVKKVDVSLRKRTQSPGVAKLVPTSHRVTATAEQRH
mmetsp:Transcript_119292/g.283173  ORF Transcript_119292/g.283173 Transcript_119292/m.283173 type:complete len:374 (+) Transcript_119292:19-1140(+)